MIVLDASAALEYLLRTPAGPLVHQAVGSGPVHVPAHFDAEVWGVVRGLLLRHEVDERTALGALFEMRRLNAERHPLTPLLLDAFVLRDRFGPDDVFYAVVARRLGATLVTCDRPFSRAAEGYVDVRYIA